ncbi:galacturonan 1,4-alpha-galacturonidase [Ranunculus cassubicifolius]
MNGFSFRSFTFILLIVFLVWSPTMELCHARQGLHWRKNRVSSQSLAKKKVKSHGKYHNKGGSKPPPASSAPEAYKKKPSPAPPENGGNSAIFNVLKFGAKGDGSADDTKAFQAAWASACKVKASTVLVPSGYTFLVGPIEFSGPNCQPNIVFQLDGTIVAPSGFKVWGSGLFQWILFSKLVGITVQGGGVFDGRGSIWWNDSPLDDPIDDEMKYITPTTNVSVYQNAPTPINSMLGQMPSIKPTVLRFYGSFDVTVSGIKIINSPQCHLKFDNCVGVDVFDMSVSSPGDSLNTDGIHLQNSRDVMIHGVNLACGDDCISIQTGCSNVYIHNVNCGPGHGISIGGLGKDNTKACVSNITVRDVMMHNTMNGVRIKTWQGGSGSVENIMFSNIQVSEVEFPIVIDQFYCDKRTCKNQTSAVYLSGINYERIRGTYTVKPVHFACSDSLPCMGVTLTGVQLKPLQEKYHMYEPFCWQTFGELSTPSIPPIDCLRIGKPPNKIQSDHDSCRA